MVTGQLDGLDVADSRPRSGCRHCGWIAGQWHQNHECTALADWNLRKSLRRCLRNPHVCYPTPHDVLKPADVY